ncbi:hypothetical protein [Clostridium ljungdahlii]|uniref:hypothetical protein n=1 Tax=Clostridium ljungdahlii TaxID=1538 RepID=UPI00386A7939
MDSNQLKPLYIKVNPEDNVAIIVNKDGLKKGITFENGLKLLQDIPQANKVLLKDISKDEPFIRYGEIIGFAKKI